MLSHVKIIYVKLSDIYLYKNYRNSLIKAERDIMVPVDFLELVAKMNSTKTNAPLLSKMKKVKVEMIIEAARAQVVLSSIALIMRKLADNFVDTVMCKIIDNFELGQNNLSKSKGHISMKHIKNHI